MKKVIIGIVVLILGVVSFLSCGNGSATDTENGELSYEILKKWELPNELKEISGIAWLGNDRIACVQDEDGIIFIYNLATSKIENTISFGDGGDYEGIAVIGEIAFVLRSDGVIYEVSGFEDKDFKVQKHTTGINNIKGINVEGLCADPQNNRLLMAIKDRKGLEGKNEVYAFNLDRKNTGKDPFFIVNLSDTIFKDVKGNSKNRFSPGAISINPQTGELYILDGTNPKILINDKNGSIKELVMLTSKDFGNPEGLTFSEQGDLYISNEAAGSPANILKVLIQN